MVEFNYINLAVLDFVPSIAFGIGAVFLVRFVLRVHKRPVTSLMIAGSALVFFGGFFKAIWKLLNVTNGVDIRLLSELQFVLLAPGFLFMLISIVWFNRLGKTTPIPLPALVPWKIPFLAVMVLSSLGMHGILTYMSFQRHLRLAAAGFIIAFISVLGIGGMASGDQTLRMQWIEEGINSIGQMGFALGCILLFHAPVHHPGKAA